MEDIRSETTQALQAIIISAQNLLTSQLTVD
jgi:hypothetical protein